MRSCCGRFQNSETKGSNFLRNPTSGMSQFALGLTRSCNLLFQANNHVSNKHMNKLATILLTSVLLTFSANTFAAETSSAPKTVIHVVTVKWKADTTPKQIEAALEGVKALPAAYPGIKRVWVKTVKTQGDKANAIVMEFADEAALKEYSNSPAQKEWYKLYTPIRESSTTFDITN
jgi:hypothetical protein